MMFTVKEIEYLKDAIFYYKEAQTKRYEGFINECILTKEIKLFDELINDLDENYMQLCPKLEYLRNELREAEEKKYER